MLWISDWGVMWRWHPPTIYCTGTTGASFLRINNTPNPMWMRKMFGNLKFAVRYDALLPKLLFFPIRPIIHPFEFAVITSAVTPTHPFRNLWHSIPHFGGQFFC
jgi:hypothetical protein